MYQSEELSLTEKYLLANKVRSKLFSCVQDTKSDNVSKSRTSNKRQGNGTISNNSNNNNNNNNNRHRSHGQVDFDLRVLVGHAMVLDRLMDDINHQVASNEERYVERGRTPTATPAVSAPSSLRNEEKYEYYYSDSDSDSDSDGDSTEEEEDDDGDYFNNEGEEEEEEYQYTTAPVRTLYSQSNKSILLMDPHRTSKHEYEHDQQIDILEEQCSSDEDSSASEEEEEKVEEEEKDLVEAQHHYESHHQDLFYLSQRAASNSTSSDYTVSHSNHGIYTNAPHINNHSTEEVDLGTMNAICV